MSEDYKVEELDEKVIPLVRYFNENGLKTYMSCQGHNDTYMSMFWIQFDESVTEEDISKFMNNHLRWWGSFISAGRFAERVIGSYSAITQQWQLVKCWCYFASSYKAADYDLERWQQKEWEGFEGAKYKEWREETMEKYYRRKENEIHK